MHTQWNWINNLFETSCCMDNLSLVLVLSEASEETLWTLMTSPSVIPVYQSNDVVIDYSNLCKMYIHTLNSEGMFLNQSTFCNCHLTGIFPSILSVIDRKRLTFQVFPILFPLVSGKGVVASSCNTYHYHNTIKWWCICTWPPTKLAAYNHINKPK